MMRIFHLANSIGFSNLWSYSIAAFAVASTIFLAPTLSLAADKPDPSSDAASHLEVQISPPENSAYLPGDKLDISVKKNGGGQALGAWLFSATTKGQRVRMIEAISVERTAIHETGASFSYSLPADLPEGNYVIVVKNSELTINSAVIAVQMGIQFSEESAIEKVAIKSFNLRDFGNSGWLRAETTEASYSLRWGGSCPALNPAVAGLVTVYMAAPQAHQLTLYYKTLFRFGNASELCWSGAEMKELPSSTIRSESIKPQP